MRRWVEHTAELELAIEAADSDGVFAEALAALAEVLAEDAAGPAEEREVEVVAPDLPALLVAWLEELLFLAETEGFVAQRVVRIARVQNRIDATVAGVRCNPSTLVKAVTYHRLEMAAADGDWRGRVVFDV